MIVSDVQQGLLMSWPQLKIIVLCFSQVRFFWAYLEAVYTAYKVLPGFRFRNILWLLLTRAEGLV